jgi:hypothetical protein
MVSVIPEQTLITTMWCDVVDRMCRHHEAALLARLTRRMIPAALAVHLPDEPLAILSPPAIVTTVCC